MLLYALKNKVRCFYETFYSGTLNKETSLEVFLNQGTTINAAILIKILMSVFQEMYIGSCIHRII